VHCNRLFSGWVVACVSAQRMDWNACRHAAG
jgi:hypothetical protein